MRRIVFILALMSCAGSVWAQAPPNLDLSAAAQVSRALADLDDSEEEIDWAIVTGSASYIAGAAGAVYLSYALVPADSVRGHRIPLRVAAGVVGGTLIGATTVFIANGADGNLPLMMGGALAGQAIGAGVAVAFVLLDAALGVREPAFSWMSIAVVLGTPIFAAVGADMVNGGPGL